MLPGASRERPYTATIHVRFATASCIALLNSALSADICILSAGLTLLIAGGAIMRLM